MNIKSTYSTISVSKIICVVFLAIMVANSSIAQTGITWTSRTSAADNSWFWVTYGNGLFVAVASSGIGNRIMTSPDGITWTTRSSAADNGWISVTYGNGQFVAVASSGTGNRIMTSPDGITWTGQAGIADLWTSITYGNGLFVVVGQNGAGNRVMTSPDGITWTRRTTPADNTWTSVTYGNNLFVAVSSSGIANRVMTSTDGINWTSRTSAADYSWLGVTYGNGLYVAVAASGGLDRVMTSPDGINWTLRNAPVANSWRSVAYGSGLFVGVSQTGTGDRVMTSPDGITWTSRTSAADNFWRSVVYANGMFVAVSQTGVGNRVMTSGISGTLPVQWISFTAKNNDGKNKLKWQTANETNNLRFDIERSSNSISFTKIGQVAGAFNTTEATEYSFIDNIPHAGNNYYRLKQVDIDGRFEYSTVVVVENNTDGFSFYPNPVNNRLMVTGLKEAGKPHRYTITNSGGQTVLTGSLPADNSINTERLQKGLYYLSIDGVTRKVEKR